MWQTAQSHKNKVQVAIKEMDALILSPVLLHQPVECNRPAPRHEGLVAALHWQLHPDR